MSSQLVPLTSGQNQSFSTQLTVDGQALALNLYLNYVAMSGWWQLQIRDVGNNILVASVPLITGLYPGANLLAQYGYLKIGSVYLLNISQAPNDYPGQNNLTDFALLWGDTAP